MVSASTIRSTINGVTVGAGTHWANAPLTAAPQPKPRVDGHHRLGGGDAVHGADHQRRLEPVGIDLPGDRHLLRIARTSGGHDPDLAELVGPAPVLAQPDLHLSQRFASPRSSPFRPPGTGAPHGSLVAPSSVGA